VLVPTAVAFGGGVGVGLGQAAGQAIKDKITGTPPAKSDK
jgi:hypothetical protein